MARPTIAPTGVERPFAVGELFFSTTDPGGRIRTGNDVFVRVSGHPREELIGAAHNVIRHPAMPRSVFRLFWDRLEAGLPVAAYVLNLAADGGHYWVMAGATPVGDELLSIRLKPTSSLLDAARAIYADVLAVEQRVEAGDPRRRKEAIAAGGERLLERLRDAGFADYEAFMHAALTREVRARDEALGVAAHDRLAVRPGTPASMVGVLTASTDAHRELDRFVQRISTFAATGERLHQASGFLSGLALDVRDFSLNASLASSRLAAEGAALGAVAATLRSCSETTAEIVTGLGGDIDRTTRRLGEVAFRIASAKLQVEIAMVFVHELADGHGHDELATLGSALGEGVEAMLGSLQDLAADLRTLVDHARGVERELRVMRALEVNGRIEAARLRDAETVVSLFSSITRTVAQAMDEVLAFRRATEAAGRHDVVAEQRLQAGVARAATEIAALAA